MDNIGWGRNSCISFAKGGGLVIHLLFVAEVYKQFSMKFGHLILRKIIKFVATRCQILRLKCAKIDSGWGFAHADPARELTALRHIPWLDLTGPTSKRREGEGKEGRKGG